MKVKVKTAAQTPRDRGRLSDRRGNLQFWRNKTSRWLFSWGVVIVSGAVLMSALWGQHGYLALRRQRQVLRQEEQNRDRAKAEQLRLKKEVEELNRREGIERVAREEMKLAQPDEIVVKLPETSESKEPAKNSDPKK